jgi:2-haloacid dehalogenase
MLDFSRFEVLTFDCYGTLIDWEDGILRYLEDLLSAHTKNAKHATLLEMFGELEAAAERGEYRSYREVLGSVARGFGERLGFPVTEEQADWLASSLPQWKPWPDTVLALRRLQQRFRLAIISNVDDDLFAGTLPKLEVEFSQIVTAQQARAYKPSLQIFNLALSRLNVPAARILHVGQSIYHDVVPAQTLGLATVWVNRPSLRTGVGAVKQSRGQPDLEVHCLVELADLCG